MELKDQPSLDSFINSCLAIPPTLLPLHRSIASMTITILASVLFLLLSIVYAKHNTVYS